MTHDQPDPIEPVASGDRAAALARLHELVRTGELSLDEFTAALDRVLDAETQVGLEHTVGNLPSLVRLTPRSRRATGPVRVDAGIHRVELGEGWQLGEDTIVTTNTARVRVDLTRASWDATVIDLRLEANTGKIDVIVPSGVAVQLQHIAGRVSTDHLAPALPGGPIVRVQANAKSGRIRIANA